jgi:hypothetical protein
MPDFINCRVARRIAGPMQLGNSLARSLCEIAENPRKS